MQSSRLQLFLHLGNARAPRDRLTLYQPFRDAKNPAAPASYSTRRDY